MTIFMHLVATHLKVFTQGLLDEFINLCIWVIFSVGITAYLMTSFGLTVQYSSFILVATCASAGLFALYSDAIRFMSDLEGDKVISYYLTLPIKPRMVLLSYIVSYAIKYAIMGILILPMGKIILWNVFDITQISILKFLLIYLAVQIFYGILAIFLVSLLRGMGSFDNLWMRFIFPMWSFGGYNFSWMVLYKFSHKLGYLGLLNPITYIMEGMRAAVLGQAGYLPFWVSLGAIGLFSGAFLYIGIARLKKRLDFI